MYFHKIHHPANFRFVTRAKQRAGRGTLRAGDASIRFEIRDLGESVFRLRCDHDRWPADYAHTKLDECFNGASDWKLAVSGDGSLKLAGAEGQTMLQTARGRGFGVSGRAWLLQFQHNETMQFYGMGEKTLGLELSRQRTKFWNADVWADFSFHRVVNESADPMYLSIPHLIIKQQNTYIGILINNPRAAFMATAPDLRIVPHLDRENQPIVDFYLGAPDGAPDVYFIAGPSLDGLTRKLQRLCGVTPRPPLWALGHHQCRWGYQSFADLDRLDREFRKHKIPCDGLWIDIDYMRGYRVFTIDKTHFSNPRKQLAELKRRGRRIIPIIDPGVKVDNTYDVYRDGLRHRAFCLNPSGTPFVGFVWPGATVFPDFSMPRARRWWAKWTRKLAANGFDGAWIDMNDPSTGPSEPSEMLFNEGRIEHDAYHNLYANGMAQATRDGFEQARPGLRQFTLTRSGSIGISKLSAVWTGDNFSNGHHLRQCIPTSLNLALSGVPFNGPDVPGFGGDATPELAIAWYKACFLFPFLRNHSAIHTREQEPWAFGTATTKIIGDLIRLRYRLLPYLYNLFIEQERSGRAILRPLFHDFLDTPALPLGKIADQFLVGPAIMQAPVVEPAGKIRRIVLPDAEWFDSSTGRWLRGNRTITAKATAASTPLFIRDGSIIPMQNGDAKDLRDIELHLFLSPKFSGEAVFDYTADDGETVAYQRGEETRVRFIAKREGAAIRVRAETISSAAGKIRARLVAYSSSRIVCGNERAMRPHRWNFNGADLPCRISSPIQFG